MYLNALRCFNHLAQVKILISPNKRAKKKIENKRGMESMKVLVSACHGIRRHETLPFLELLFPHVAEWGQNLSLQNMPLWPNGYFRLIIFKTTVDIGKAPKIQQMLPFYKRNMYLSECHPLSTKKRMTTSLETFIREKVGI